MSYTDEKKFQKLSTMVPITYLNSMTLGHLEVHDLKFGQACQSTLYKLSMPNGAFPSPFQSTLN